VEQRLKSAALPVVVLGILSLKNMDFHMMNVQIAKQFL
jgi:hypothetical protein